MYDQYVDILTDLNLLLQNNTGGVLSAGATTCNILARLHFSTDPTDKKSDQISSTNSYPFLIFKTLHIWENINHQSLINLMLYKLMF